MSITRRQFLLGTTAGFILPSFYERAYSYFENHGEPLLESPAKPDDILYASSEYSYDGYALYLGQPDTEPPKMTIREFCVTYGHGDPERWWREQWLGVDENEPIDTDMDAEMDFWAVVDWWGLRDSPNARAHHYLKSLDLGPRLNRARAVGELDFICGPCPGNDYIGVEARDGVTLSLLQHRLNELKTGVQVKMY